MNQTNRNNLFLRQSYMDSWEEYARWLERGRGWDFIILTASNEEQAAGYREELVYRREHGYLAEDCRYLVLADPEGKRVGSGGATLNVLKMLALEYGGDSTKVFHSRRILVIHSGGDSKRIPQYSVCGKLFSPVPRELPDGRLSTLFDEFVISMSAVAGRIEEGMLVLSGDVLLLFNPLQLDFQYRGAAAISIKEPVSVGKDHGVYLNDGKSHVKRFLHKQTEDRLRELGAVNARGNVDLDTGAVLLDAELLEALYSLISTEGHYDSAKFARFVNERVRISFYGDFLYPLAEEASLEEYYMEAAEGDMCQELLDCRRAIWDAVSSFSMKLICLSPAEFIHFGTTWELLQLLTERIGDYHFLDWRSAVGTNLEMSGSEEEYAVYNSIISPGAGRIGHGCYIENSCIGEGVTLGERVIVSEVTLSGQGLSIPSDIVLHGITLMDGQSGKYVVRIYGTKENPKALLEEGATFLGVPIHEILERYGLDSRAIWEENEHSLWTARLYSARDSQEEAVTAALRLYEICRGTADRASVQEWLASPRMSLHGSFNLAQISAHRERQMRLGEQVGVERLLSVLKRRGSFPKAMERFCRHPMTQAQFAELYRVAEETEDFGLQIRIYYFLAKYIREEKFEGSLRTIELIPAVAGEGCKREFAGISANALEERCFAVIGKRVCDASYESLPQKPFTAIAKDACDVELPVRVNWGGGWTDTPPYCNENGGIVLNAALKLNGICPVQVSIRRLSEYHVEFASEDIGAASIITKVSEILDCQNPYDHFALHKAAFIACGIVREDMEEPLPQLLKRMGGGIYLSTKVVGIPKGSGLGTSSILSGACIRAVYEFLGWELDPGELYDRVLCMEQIMSTGGGWQDQVGGLCPGIKLITTKKGLKQHIQVETLELAPETIEELQERFALIYTGQRRLARNLLRDVVGNYISGREESIQALEEMRRVAVLMKYELERGDIDRFAALMNEHWRLSLQLDGGASNTCIDQIFLACQELISGKFIAGAGGGGFLQVILKKGVTKEQLNARLYEMFQDSGVGVWDSEFV